MRKLISSILILAASLFAHAQTSATPVARMPNAIAVCPEGSTITAIPVGTVYQLGVGAGANYTPPAVISATSPAAVPFSTTYSPSMYPFDPDNGVLKTFYVQQQLTPYTVSCRLQGATVATDISIPAALPASPPTTLAGMLQTLQYICSAPVVGTKTPAGLPTGLILVCSFNLANIPIVVATAPQ